MSGEYTLILASDYNVIQSKINQILGTGSGDYGYGQPVTSIAETITTPITAGHWASLRVDILRAKQHLSGADETGNLAPITNSTIISGATLTQFQNMLTSIETSRTTRPPNTQATRDQLVTETTITHWNTTLTHVFAVNFASADGARFFFNSGSSIDISASRTGGSVNMKNTSWTTMLTNMGVISFALATSSVSGTGTVTNSLGWASLTTVDQLLFQKLTETSIYSPNQYDIYVRQGTSSAQLIFTVKFQDLSAPVGNGIDEFVDGTLTSVVQTYRSSGVNVSVYAPSAQDWRMNINIYS